MGLRAPLSTGRPGSLGTAHERIWVNRELRTFALPCNAMRCRAMPCHAMPCNAAHRAVASSRRHSVTPPVSHTPSPAGGLPPGATRRDGFHARPVWHTFLHAMDSIDHGTALSGPAEGSRGMPVLNITCEGRRTRLLPTLLPSHARGLRPHGPGRMALAAWPWPHGPGRGPCPPPQPRATGSPSHLLVRILIPLIILPLTLRFICP